MIDSNPLKIHWLVDPSEPDEARQVIAVEQMRPSEAGDRNVLQRVQKTGLRWIAPVGATIEGDLHE